MKHNTWDAVNGTAAVGFVASYLAGWDWPAIAAFLAAVYTLSLLVEKVYGWVRRFRERKPK